MSTVGFGIIIGIIVIILTFGPIVFLLLNQGFSKVLKTIFSILIGVVICITMLNIFPYFYDGSISFIFPTIFYYSLTAMLSAYGIHKINNLLNGVSFANNTRDKTFRKLTNIYIMIMWWGLSLLIARYIFIGEINDDVFAIGSVPEYLKPGPEKQGLFDTNLYIRFLPYLFFFFLLRIWLMPTLLKEKRKVKLSETDTNGSFVFANGDKYEGEWKNGLMHGKGTLIKNDGAKKEGIWKNGKLIE